MVVSQGFAHEPASLNEGPTKPVFLDDSNGPKFYVRSNASTRLMDVREASEFIAARWPGVAWGGQRCYRENCLHGPLTLGEWSALASLSANIG